MSRAKDPSIIKESQKLFGLIRTIAVIVTVFVAIFIVYSILTKKDPDVKNIDAIIQKQAEKAARQDLAPYRKRISELKKTSNSRRLSEAELRELDWLAVKTVEVKEGLRIKYSSSGEKPHQIYPNYDFKGVNEIKVPLLPISLLRKKLPREAGGWVMVPVGARAHVDNKVPIIIENVDGNQSDPIGPRDAGWFGVEPGNGMVRYYGPEGEFVTVSIKRGFYK